MCVRVRGGGERERFARHLECVRVRNSYIFLRFTMCFVWLILVWYIIDKLAETQLKVGEL